MFNEERETGPQKIWMPCIIRLEERAHGEFEAARTDATVKRDACEHRNAVPHLSIHDTFTTVSDLGRLSGGGFLGATR